MSPEDQSASPLVPRHVNSPCAVKPVLGTPEPEGVWALIDRDMGESITSVYPSELDALRQLNGRGYGRVEFLQWGHEVNG